MVISKTNAEYGPTGMNKVQIWDEIKAKFTGEARSRNEVKGVTLRRDIMVMVCEYSIYVYKCDNLAVILYLTTHANPRGLCALAVASEPWVLCCPGQSRGSVRVQVGQGDEGTHVFQAHQSALAALSLNASGSLVATASEKGTLVQVFYTKDGQQLYRLRRGGKPAQISCLTFSPDDHFLGVASSSSTVHVFKLDSSTESRDGDTDHLASTSSPSLGPAEDPTLPDSPAGGYGGSKPPTAPIEQLASHIHKAVSAVSSRATAETVTDAVKGVIPKYFNDLRSFAQFRIPDMEPESKISLPFDGVEKSSVAAVDVRSKQSGIIGPQLAFHATEPRLYVLHYSGVFYECSFNPDHDLNHHGVQEMGYDAATTWFATRPDFKVQGLNTEVVTIEGGAQEGEGGEADEWQLL
eukprot:TRINITY_DN39031_c0_g1_i1.p1 TRINITY_DN39031_c0_g1~~TRINITY_DN39031_c0_g1_i1.p1  ORF type:complete len:436 (+),score=87.09 TRINITY_DN39031_c0_g1_i1:87-1310(+)